MFLGRVLAWLCVTFVCLEGGRCTFEMANAWLKGLAILARDEWTAATQRSLEAAAETGNGKAGPLCRL